MMKVLIAPVLFPTAYRHSSALPVEWPLVVGQKNLKYTPLWSHSSNACDMPPPSLEDSLSLNAAKR